MDTYVIGPEYPYFGRKSVKISQNQVGFFVCIPSRLLVHVDASIHDIQWLVHVGGGGWCGSRVLLLG